MTGQPPFIQGVDTGGTVRPVDVDANGNIIISPINPVTVNSGMSGGQLFAQLPSALINQSFVGPLGAGFNSTFLLNIPFNQLYRLTHFSYIVTAGSFTVARLGISQGGAVVYTNEVALPNVSVTYAFTVNVLIPPSGQIIVQTVGVAAAQLVIGQAFEVYQL